MYVEDTEKYSDWQPVEMGLEPKGDYFWVME